MRGSVAVVAVATAHVMVHCPVRIGKKNIRLGIGKTGLEGHFHHVLE